MRRVNLYVDRPSCIELHVRETVRLDRLQPTETDGYIAAQHGALLAPGVTQVPLEAGIYHLRTLEEAELRVLTGGVQVTSTTNTKGGLPDPPRAINTDGAAASAVRAAFDGAGNGPCGRVPALHVTYDTEGAP